METSTRLGLYIFIGLVIGGVIGRWGFGYPVYGAILGGALFAALAWALDRSQKGKGAKGAR